MSICPLWVADIPELPEGGLKGGISGREIPCFSKVKAGPRGVSSPVLAGVVDLLALAGGCPVGIEGGALFLPFLGGVVDIDGEYLA